MVDDGSRDSGDASDDVPADRTDGDAPDREAATGAESHGDGSDGADPNGDNGPRVEGYGTLMDLTSHFYRGELDRITTWRSRMDRTTNWAVVVMAAVLTWSFSNPDNPHYVILIGAAAVGVFLFVEAQRFQGYDAWRRRVQTLQQDFFAPGYDGRPPEDDRWRDWLGEDLRDPTIRLSLSLAVGHRLAHVYLPLLSVFLLAWWLRIGVFGPETTISDAAAIGAVPGLAVVAFVVGVYLVLAALTAHFLRRNVRREFEYETDEDDGPGDR